MKYQIKITTGYGGESFTVPMDEAHKAYFLFNNPTARGTFNNGLALRGQDIMRIEPDYNGYFGWAQTYKPSGDDFSMINSARRKFEKLLLAASEMGKTSYKLSEPMSGLLGEYQVGMIAAQKEIKMLS